MNIKSQHLKAEKNQGFLKVTIDRENKMNAMNATILCELLELFKSVEDDMTIGFIFITGKGRAFCSGQDLAEVNEDFSAEHILKTCYLPLVKHMTSSSKIYIAAVNGIAAGAGFSLALSCDMIVMSYSAKMSLGFSKIGLIPDAGSTFKLIQSLGYHRAIALALTNNALSSTDAIQFGLVDKVFDDDEFVRKSEHFVAELAQGSFQAAYETKRLFQKALHNDFDTQLELETDIQSKLISSADFREGLLAFTEKRVPNFNQKQ